jgi:hypothetical protein
MEPAGSAMSMDGTKSTLEPLVVEACVGLFGTLNVPLRPSVPEYDRDPLRLSSRDLTVASLRFSGTAMRGTLVLATTFEVLAASRPRETRRRVLSSSSAGDWLYVRDWSKELVNQILGRIKRHVVARGLTFEIGTPSALTGDAASAFIRHQTAEPTHFASGAAPVTVWFDVDISPHAAASIATKGAELLAKEGDIVLF